jgi:hypothetical protein
MMLLAVAAASTSAIMVRQNLHKTTMAVVDRIPSPLLGQIASYLAAPDPFLTHFLVEDMVASPNKSNNNDLLFEVDDYQRIKHVQVALSDASNVFAYEGPLIDQNNELWEPTNWMPLFHGVLMSEDEQQAVRESLEQKKLPIHALLKVATPAPSGRDGENIFDPDVCKVFEIPRGQLPSDLIKVLDLNIRWCKRQIEDKMKPTAKKWRYHVHTIHMCGPGGKIDDHVDTLHKNNHVATVVLSLPAEHVGGVLRIRFHGEALEFDSAKGPKQYDDSRHLRYVAFFTDCAHSVQEIISGWRVVVQYDVYEEHGDDNQGDDEDHDDYDDDYEVTVEEVWNCFQMNERVCSSKIHNKEQTELVQAVLQYMSRLPPTHGVAFFLRHRYSLSTLNEAVLKGVDRAIFDAFSKRGDLSVSIQGVLVYIETVDQEQVSVDVTAVSIKDFTPDASDDDDDELSRDSPNDNDATGGNTHLTTAATSPKSTVHLIVDKNNDALHVNSFGEDLVSGYDTYFVGCMIIRSIEDGKPAKR